MKPISQRVGGLPRFAVESTLGRLAKWLRLAGFDACMDRGTPDAGRLLAMARHPRRIILTRTTGIFGIIGPDRAIFIRHNGLEDQLRQIMRELGINIEDLRPMTICTSCNQRLIPADKADLFGVIPEHVWHHHTIFFKCPQCCKIYWPGSHADAVKKSVASWFEGA